MELGGNGPLIVFDDADLETAVEGAMVAKMRNGGASCIAANRIYVQHGLADRFADEFARRMEAVRMGAYDDGDDVALGPLVSDRERQRVAALVATAINGGATAMTGGVARVAGVTSIRRQF